VVAFFRALRVLSGDNSEPSPLDQEGVVTGFSFTPEVDGKFPMMEEGGMSVFPWYSGMGRESKGRVVAGVVVMNSWSRSCADSGCSEYPGGGVGSRSGRAESSGVCELVESLRGKGLFEGGGEWTSSLGTSPRGSVGGFGGARASRVAGLWGEGGVSEGSPKGSGCREVSACELIVSLSQAERVL
jgi:hypothetical protein